MSFVRNAKGPVWTCWHSGQTSPSFTSTSPQRAHLPASFGAVCPRGCSCRSSVCSQSRHEKRITPEVTHPGSVTVTPASHRWPFAGSARSAAEAGCIISSSKNAAPQKLHAQCALTPLPVHVGDTAGTETGKWRCPSRQTSSAISAAEAEVNVTVMPE